MIKGIGTDIVKLSRIKLSNLSFLAPEEIAIFKTLSQSQKIQFLGGRWAAKEAIFKAWKNCPKNFKKLVILNNDQGLPYLKDNPNILLSISHEVDYAVAYSIYQENS